jgi:predicted transcriptional regulator
MSLPVVQPSQPPKGRVSPTPKKATKKSKAPRKATTGKNIHAKGGMDPVHELQVANALVAAFADRNASYMEDIIRRLPLRRPSDSTIMAILKEFANRKLLDFTSDGRIACLRSRRLQQRIEKLQKARPFMSLPVRPSQPPKGRVSPTPKKATKKSKAPRKVATGKNIPAKGGMDPVHELQVAKALVAAFEDRNVSNLEDILRRLPLRRPSDSTIRAILKEFANRKLLDFTSDERIACLRSRKLRERIMQLQKP